MRTAKGAKAVNSNRLDAMAKASAEAIRAAGDPSVIIPRSWSGSAAICSRRRPNRDPSAIRRLFDAVQPVKNRVYRPKKPIAAEIRPRRP
jgi:hypothetical protein